MHPNSNPRMHETLFASTEGRMLGVGLALTGLMLLAFGIGWHLYPDRILPYAIMTGLNLIIGREAGMSQARRLQLAEQ